MTTWMEERDRLVAVTRAFVQDVAAGNPFRPASPVQPAAVAKEPAAPARVAVVATTTPAPSSKPASPKRALSPVSERDEIMQRVAAFKAHQHRLIKERETYYASVQSQIRSVLRNDFKPGGL